MRVPDTEVDKLLSEPYHFCDILLVSNATSNSTPLRFINHTNSWDSKSNTSISYEGGISKSPVGNLFNSLIQARLYPLGLVGDISKAYLKILVSSLDAKLRLFIWFDKDLNQHINLRRTMDFGDPQSSLVLNIAQIKFITPLLVYMLSFIIVPFAKYADNHSSSVRNRQEYKLISDDLR